MLVRYHEYGERTCWQVCRVPTRQQEAERRLDREYDRLKKERKGHVNRIRSLLELHGVQVGDVCDLKPGRIRDRWGRVLEAPWQDEIGRQLERLRLVDEHLKVLAKQRQAALRKPQTEADRKAARLKWLHGIGEISATALSREFFAWRQFNNRREVGAAAGLTGCPYDSGESRVEQGITKAGSRRVRMLMIELAWMWLRHQPNSALSQWFEKRFAKGGKRMRRIGIVALARKLLVALWKFLEWGLVPQGAIVYPTEPLGDCIAPSRGS
jgi:transposase